MKLSSRVSPCRACRLLAPSRLLGRSQGPGSSCTGFAWTPGHLGYLGKLAHGYVENAFFGNHFQHGVNYILVQHMFMTGFRLVSDAAHRIFRSVRSYMAWYSDAMALGAAIVAR